MLNEKVSLLLISDRSKFERNTQNAIYVELFIGGVMVIDSEWERELHFVSVPYAENTFRKVTNPSLLPFPLAMG